ncbi:MAG: hypothetical protein IPQ13_04265 [Holophagaceae bacterium]|nr:hypothetical protein [Holophagaceae bacterium]
MPRSRFLALASTIALFASGAQTIHPLTLNQEEISVYELLLGHYGGKLVVSRTIISDNPTELEATWKYVTGPNGRMWSAIPRTPALRSAFNNLVDRSKTKWQIQPWSSKYNLQNVKLPGENPPVTVFSFSPIGFDVSRTIAVVIRSGQQGPLAGSTEFIILRKKDGAWAIDEERMIGMS